MQDETNALVESSNSPPQPTEKFKLYTIDDLRQLPSPIWLIESLIGLNTLVVLYGQPASGKSFVALDMALSIASGQPWHSHGVEKKAVIYVVGEGGRGLAARVEAWLKLRGI